MVYVVVCASVDNNDNCYVDYNVVCASVDNSDNCYVDCSCANGVCGMGAGDVLTWLYVAMHCIMMCARARWE